jgi:transposase
MTFAELESQVTSMLPSLSEEGKMLVGLFLPFCESLSAENAALKSENAALKAKVKHLEDRLAINSRNSSKPPSKDDFGSPKPKSLRKKSGRSPGGQFGHKGQGGHLRDNPNDTIVYEVETCPECGQDLRAVEPDEIIRKQVVEIPPLEAYVVEHQVEVKSCPCCEIQWQAGGCDVQHQLEYGPRVKALSVYLSTYQFLPAKRVKELLSFFDIDLSTGTLDNFRKRAAQQLGGFVETMRESVLGASAAFFDETGMKVKGVGHWVHVAATSLMSLFLLHPKRGKEAHEEMGILPFFRGLIHRDDYVSYRGYFQALHALCNAHLLRELVYLIEQNGQEQWAEPLMKLLLKIKEKVDQSDKGVLDHRWQGRYRKQYRKWIELGLSLNPPKVRANGKTRGKIAQSKSYNLLVRLRDKEDQVLRFMTHSEAEFDNNQAERDLRMNKVRQKISGGFRSLEAGEEFMTIRSLIATAIKRSADPIEILTHVFENDKDSYMWLARNPE